MIKAINQWGFAEGTPLEQVFEVSRAAGFDAVELNLYPAGSVGLTMDSTASEAEAIGSMADRYGIKLRSLSTGMLWQAPLSAADESTRAEGRRIVAKQIELASLLGMDTVLVVPGVVNAVTSYEVCYSRSQDEIRRLIPAAEREQVHIGIENVWNKFLLSPLEMARYIDECESPYVGAYFDAGNVLQFGFPEQWIRILGPRIRKVHVKDFSVQVGNIHGFVPLFVGNVNWHEVRAALAEIAYNDVLTAELNPYAHDPVQMVKDTAVHLDRIMQLTGSAG
ncbi:sugar phosphate isomerase/epimerase family protein [Paenibacillus xerothermodurans]|uniref:Sugar phosphate isomerase/epimerase n=1 Tax=Paenibacillus xerothermodurans TaxID=1977292 RepID=A0A2W1P045_PAEXE|nr:sugar phosphate isomerase/epimerase family protein [Paenibacillus xerothermodurans]PZE20508.1 sugar phosphate isomerase/epimerase [Paenibacillus xerothermodurans]